MKVSLSFCTLTFLTLYAEAETMRNLYKGGQILHSDLFLHRLEVIFFSLDITYFKNACYFRLVLFNI